MWCETVTVATVLTVYGIETVYLQQILNQHQRVATVLTVYGIETYFMSNIILLYIRTLQQYLPFTVLKLPPIN